MKKSGIFARFLLPLAFFALLPNHGAAAPYGPKGRETTWVQPGGQILKLRVFGDEHYGRTETLDGHTVIFNQNDATYYYAERADNGNALKSTGTAAHLVPRAGLKAHIDLNSARIREIHQESVNHFGRLRSQRWDKRVQSFMASDAAKRQGRPLNAAALPAAAPVTGRKIGLTILAQFPDDSTTGGNDPVNFPTTKAKIDNFCNKIGYNDNGNTGSVRDFYSDQSLGKLTFKQSVTAIITLPKARDFYNYEDYPTNQILKDTGVSGNELITDAIRALRDQNFDFSDLSVDELGNVYSTSMLFAGPDSGVWANGLWPHQWNLQKPINVGTGSSPVIINAYQVTNIEDDRPVIGTFIHELGHLLLDYPDLYDILGEGVGEHCLMGSGNYLNDGKTPSPINAYFKDIVGWANVTDLLPSDSATVQLPTTGNVAYRFVNPKAATEFYYVENRGKGDKWARYSDDKGIAIWHIDELVDGNILATPHYQVSLMQADGNSDLEAGVNRGDAGDLFDVDTPLFKDSTNPSANWWNGSNSGIRVRVTGELGPSTSVQFGTLAKDSILIDSPVAGSLLLVNSTTTITWEATISGDVRIDLYKSGILKKVIAKNTRNNGKYDWEVPTDVGTGLGYSIRIRSLTNPVPASAFSDGTFEITDASFPLKNSKPYGWEKAKGALNSWVVTKSRSYEGAYSMVSSPIGDAETSAISYTSNFVAGDVTFYMRVSSEGGYDLAKFYIDGVAKVVSTTSPTRGLSGIDSDWVFLRFPLEAGKHTLTWSYEKDDSYANGKDRAWIDGVLLPRTTQEIAVKDGAWRNLTSGRGSVAMPRAKVGSKPAIQNFTIINRGKADLRFLKLSLKGSGAKHFKTSKLRRKVLKPGQKQTFTVKFAPKSGGSKKAVIYLRSNDADESPFKIAISGSTRKSSKSKSSILAIAKSSNHLGDGPANTVRIGSGGDSGSRPVSVETAEIIDGLKYLELSVFKSLVPEGRTLTVEVSPNLVDWFSGSKHTTVISDNETLLKVRDNTPVTHDAKRYIRLNTHP